MMKRRLFLPGTIYLILTCAIIVSCSKKSSDKIKLIVTEVPGNIEQAENPELASRQYLTGARIISIIPGKPGSQKILTEDFFSACGPEISYDGRSILFSAQQKENDPWQIWVMNLDNLKYRQVTSGSESCTDPAWLPGDRMMFSRLTLNDTVKSAHCLYTCNSDGSGLKQITFGPDNNVATTVLKDGRLLTLKQQLLPYQDDPMIVVMRPDGTKADMFYKDAGGSTIKSGARETADGKIVFIESDKEGPMEGTLISVSYNRPLHTRTNLTSGTGFDFYSVMPVRPDNYLVSCRKSGTGNYALYELDPVTRSLGRMVFSDPGYNIVEALPAEEYERPKKLPSEVDQEVKTGLLLCQNINFLNPETQGNSSDSRKALKIEVLGIDSTYGIVEVEEDGSFQLKIMADTPFRIRTLDKEDNTVQGPCSWLWLRPNERRGCIGCHEDPEMVPDNIVSMAIRKSPVIIPVNITEIKEKIVELE
jgi:hypothetical protein